MKFYLSHSEASNPMMYNWNAVHVRYCDGSSYAGDATVTYEKDTLYFRGRSNRDSTILSLLHENGMKNAAEIVISGCSAGGLGIYLGLDHISSIIKGANPTARVRGLSDSGFFLDHTGDKDFSKPRTGMTKYEAHINGVLDYATIMRQVYNFMNISAGANRRCVMKERENTIAGDSSNCIFAQNLAPHIRTPLFAVQPKYDQWQIWHVVGKPFNNSLVNRYGARLQGLLEARLLRSPQHGAFVDGCTHHCTSCSAPGEDSWNGQHVKSTVEQISPAEAFRRWYARGGVGATGAVAAGIGSGTGAGSGSGSGSSNNSNKVAKSGDSEARRHLLADADEPSSAVTTTTSTPASTTTSSGSGSGGNSGGTGVEHAFASTSTRDGRIFIQVAEYPCLNCCVCRP
jgi:hypothetical protein